MNVFFNDGTLDFLCINELEIEKAKEKFSEFVQTIHKLKKSSLLDDIFFQNDFITLSICKNYTVNDWLLDKTINSNWRQYFRTILGKSSILNKSDIGDESKIIYKDNKIDSIGCALASTYSEKPTVISILTNEFWIRDEFDTLLFQLNEDAEIIEKEIIISNISAKTDISLLKKEEKDSIYNNISSGQDFWERKEELFPNLIFCDSVKKQVYQDCEKFHIVKVMDRLQKMQEYFENEHEQYNPKELGMDARTESDSVKSDSELKNERLFKMPSGEEKYFFDHIGFTGKYTGGRIHFLPDVKNKKCYIGYIGRHLKTKKY